MWGAGHLCGRRRTSRTLRLNHKTLEHLLNLLVQPCCHFVRVRSLSLWRAACSSLSPLCAHRVARVVAQCSWPYSTSITLPSCHFARRRAHFAFARATPRLFVHALILILLLHLSSSCACWIALVVVRHRSHNPEHFVRVGSLLLWCGAHSS